ncbi:hypothetical protein EJB05_06051, partial [Eragrostis curvula]
MDDVSIDYSWFPFLAVAAAAVLLSLRIRRALTAADEPGANANLPPGPWNLPVIGGLHHLAAGGAAPPHRALHRLSRRHGPVMLLRVGEVATVVVSSPEAAAEVLRARDPAFASRPVGSPTQDVVGRGGTSLIFAPHGEYWRQLRKVCVHELLSATQVRRVERIRRDEVARLVQSIIAAAASPPAAVVDLGQALTELSNNIVARAAFGGKCRRQEQQEYLRELGVMAKLAGGFSLPDLFPSSRLVRWLSGAVRDMTRSRDRVQRIVGGIIRERREKRRSASSAVGEGAVAGGGEEDEDLLDVLQRLQEEDSLPFPLTEEIIGTVVSDMFGAATDTTATTLEWAMAELIRNPQAMAKAKLEARHKLGREEGDHDGDLRYIQMVIKETLRLHPAAPLILRSNLQEDCRVMGYDIPKGSTVMVNILSLARDPRYWDDAEEFIPERFESSEKDWTHLEFVPFGAGRRQCPGALFATTTIELTLANLLCHFDWTLPGGADPKKLDMGEAFGITVRRRSSLCLLPALRVPPTH